MNDKRNDRDEDAVSDAEPGSGINLTLIYSLIGLALVAAIVIATIIVLPFYHRR